MFNGVIKILVRLSNDWLRLKNRTYCEYMPYILRATINKYYEKLAATQLLQISSRAPLKLIMVLKPSAHRRSYVSLNIGDENQL